MGPEDSTGAPSIPGPPLIDPRRRPRAQGKFLFAGPRKLHIQGFTYGPFSPNGAGEPFPERAIAERDLTAIASTGANALRVYTVPPVWLLDAAARRGLRVMVGIPWEQHVAFLDEPGLARDIENTVREGVRACRRHPAILCYAVGNEIPASVVRWTGRRRIERHIERLCGAARGEDPNALVTYVNYPSTEYLDLDFIDVVAFNVYLESVDRLKAYLKRLHNLAGDRPLLMAELGLDAAAHGEGGQAWGLVSQLRATVTGGCAGTFVFSWTDEWHAGGRDMTDWRFGVTTRHRQPKPALTSVRRAFAVPARSEQAPSPPVSVVICAYNSASTLDDCLEGATRLRYPDFEVIVVDDGSTDDTSAIARRHSGVRLVRTPNRGLGQARNTGIEAATGDIIAFTDADARPDPDWLTHLVGAFEANGHAGIGGPNIAPPGDGPVAECVAHAPGGPIHVLLSDDEAEHIPGCNMAFRREALAAIGGFDPRFRVAGDDVDVCWRIRAQGMTLGFSPAAMVWHHPRPSVRAYWRQQAGYGRAEALLEEKWPEKYNSAGHVTWGGRVYQPARRRLLARQRIYHGVWGGAPYQSSEPRAPSVIASLVATPEWYLVIAAILFLTLLGLTWSPLLFAFPALVLATAPVVVRAVVASTAARFTAPRGSAGLARRRWLTALLHLLQPAARLRGRLLCGLTPWRLRSARRFVWPALGRAFVWSESRRTEHAWVERLDEALRRMRATVLCGGPFDRWDLLVKSGFTGRARVYTCTEEHGNGRQFVRFRFVPVPSLPGIVAVGSFLGLGAWAAADGAWFAALTLLLAGIAIAARVVMECGGVLSACLEAVDDIEPARRRVRATENRGGETAGPGRARGPGDAPTPSRADETADAEATAALEGVLT